MVTVAMPAVDVRAEVQGNVLEAYRLACVRHVVVRVNGASRARAALAAMLDARADGPTVTSGAPYDGPQRTPCLNVGITWLGLRALGVPGASLRTFPPEFREGMVARAARLGDVGPSAPGNWIDCLRRPASVHLILSVHAETAPAAASTAADLLRVAGKAFHPIGVLDGEALVEDTPGVYGLYHDVPAVADDGTPTTSRRGEHFGFRDGISQPRFAGIGRPPSPREPLEPLGVVLLGHPSTSPVGVPVPKPEVLGSHGSFTAFRVLAQDVAGLRRYVAEAAAATGVEPELLRAKLCGRWPNGVPLALASTAAEAARVLAAGCDLDGFDFTDDQDGATCPIGSHARRCNPRAAQIVQRPANRSRRLVRRGVPYGPWLEHGQEDVDHRERGLLGSFLCASLSSQFEAMQYDWVNLGLQDPSITSTNDPLVGANEPPTSSFTFHTDGGGWRTLRRLPRFVTTRGGAYCFVPGMSALRWIATAGWSRTAR
ncbi:MAG: Dyp-type peroxidase [Acidimicrobiales bacterium]